MQHERRCRRWASPGIARACPRTRPALGSTCWHLLEGCLLRTHPACCSGSRSAPPASPVPALPAHCIVAAWHLLRPGLHLPPKGRLGRGNRTLPQGAVKGGAGRRASHGCAPRPGKSQREQRVCGASSGGRAACQARHRLLPLLLPLPLPSPSRQALGLRPEDVFTAEMLSEALEESSGAFEETLRREAPPPLRSVGLAM